MTLCLHNTLTGKIELFRPLHPDRVSMYVCGPTVYDRAHLGNFRPVVVFDVLYRFLKKFYDVTYVRNITDIDDKIINAARASGKSIGVLTEETTRFFHEDSQSLGALQPTIEPRATTHIPEMIALIKVLFDQGLAYEVQEHVLFHVPNLPSYGELSHIRRKDMIAGARVEVAPYKKDPSDFILWKPSDETQPGWESPWGYGRPGWHIECSAMSLKHLGESFDIHAGGQDLIFPHHENEIAQSTGAHGAGTFARYWLHNGVLTINGEKMSKSLGNFITLTDLLQKARGETIRLALLLTHYRQPLDLTDETLPRARAILNRLYGALEDFDRHFPAPSKEIDAQVVTALKDDLNTPLALSRLHSLASEIYKLPTGSQRSLLQHTLWTSGEVLGLLQSEPQSWLQGKGSSSQELSVEEIEEWIGKRTAARQAKDFIESDRIRDMLAAHGVLLLDSPASTTWRRT